MKRQASIPICAALIALMVAAHAAPQAAAQSPGTETTVHIVAWGDSLAVVAARYGVSQQAVIEANNLASADVIYAGQRLIIPGTPGAAAPAPASSADWGGQHVVRPAENLYRIGLMYGLTVPQIMAANGLVDENALYAGQVLSIPAPGGTAAIPAADEPAPAAAPASAGSASHVVQAGEILASIASRYGVAPAALIQANNISNPSLIYTGQVLRIPQAGEAAPAPSPVSASAPGSRYIVRQGDTLFRIALNQGVTMDALMQANGLDSPDRIYTGQALSVPSGQGVPLAQVQPAQAAPVEAAPTAQPTPPPAAAPGSDAAGKEIVVDLSQQRVYAYQDGELLNSFVVSTGLPATPTVTGTYSVYLKYTSQAMSGPGYYLPGVPWVMYFYKGYAIHGTYWHSNFGSPMSHGCVNLRTGEAEWLYNWAPMGTQVRVIV